MHSTTYKGTCSIICAKTKPMKKSVIPVFHFINVNRLGPTCNMMCYFSSHAKFYCGEGEYSNMFLIKKKCIFPAAAASWASFHSLSSQRVQQGTVIATVAPNLPPPKFK